MGDKKKNIVVVGFKGCGKTAVGKILAKKLGKGFTDTDALIEDIHKRKTGEDIPFRQIFQNRGKDYFLSLEREAVENIAKMDDRVISLGGGTLFGEADTENIKHLGIIIFLYVEEETLYKRIMAKGIPPFFDKESPKKSFDSIYKKRIDTYRDVSNIIIDNTEITPEGAAKEIIEQLKGYNVR